jgi:hypothetical protein
LPAATRLFEGSAQDVAGTDAAGRVPIIYSLLL